MDNTARVIQVNNESFESNKMYWWGDKKKEASLADVLASAPPGWSGIIKTLIPDLFALGWDGEVDQVKEKFGGLRFYIGSGSNEIFDRIAQAENDSNRTCEVCGAPGVSRRGGWIRTLCDEHNK